MVPRFIIYKLNQLTEQLRAICENRTDLHNPSDSAESEETVDHTIGVAASTVLGIGITFAVEMLDTALNLSVGNAWAAPSNEAWIYSRQ